jgi:hypothetical protein
MDRSKAALYDSLREVRLLGTVMLCARDADDERIYLISYISRGAGTYF